MLFFTYPSSFLNSSDNDSQIFLWRKPVPHSPTALYMPVWVLSSDSLWPRWTVACWAPLSIGFFRQEHWSGLPFLSPRDLPDSGIEPTSPTSPTLAEGFSITLPPGKPALYIEQIISQVPWGVMWLRSGQSASMLVAMMTDWLTNGHMI